MIRDHQSDPLKLLYFDVDEVVVVVVVGSVVAMLLQIAPTVSLTRLSAWSSVLGIISLKQLHGAVQKQLTIIYKG